MMTRISFFLGVVLGVAGFAQIAGCSKSADKPAAEASATTPEAGAPVDPHDVPITDQQKAELRTQTAQFADAVATIRQFRDQIQQETASGLPANPFDAHQSLDKADLVLQWLPEIARDSGVAKENWEAVNTTANDLRTLFEQVHQNIDEKQDPEFAAVATAIDEKLSSLEQIGATASAGTEEPN